MGRIVAAAALAWGPAVGARAEVVDQVRTVSASGSIGAQATLTVTARNVSGDTVASGGLAFGTVSVGTTPWDVAPQYLQVQYHVNHSNWAVRILTNNKAAFPTMVGKVLDAKVLADPNDDILGYAGMIGSTPTDPNDRVTLAWQVFRNTVAGGPADPTDLQVGGAFNSAWALLADASDCPSTATNCRSATPATIDKTLEFFRVVQGDASTSGLLLHPDNGDRVGDGDIAVYVAGRFGGAPADSYSTTIGITLYHF
jgi:hypothetical protein